MLFYSLFFTWFKNCNFIKFQQIILRQFWLTWWICHTKCLCKFSQEMSFPYLQKSGIKFHNQWNVLKQYLSWLYTPLFYCHNNNKNVPNQTTCYLLTPSPFLHLLIKVWLWPKWKMKVKIKYTHTWEYGWNRLAWFASFKILKTLTSISCDFHTSHEFVFLRVYNIYLYI